MVKSEYFCDRCGTKVSSEYALYRASIAQHGKNSTTADLCDGCVIDMLAALKKKPPVAASGKE